MEYQTAKDLVRAYYRELDAAKLGGVAAVLSRYTADTFRFRSVHPFDEIKKIEQVAARLWDPLRTAVHPLQRREDVFMAGLSETDGQVWVCSMGHLQGLFDQPWLGIPSTRKMVFIRYVEFHRILNTRIAETALFFDIVGVMRQAGIAPLPLQTAAEVVVPGPKTHDGLMYKPQSKSEGSATLKLVNRMRDDLYALRYAPDPEGVLARTWHDDMLWFGPSGIGSTYTIKRYHKQHQAPFWDGLTDIASNGQTCRIAEGKYAAWFGWPIMRMRSTGGFLGLPSADIPLTMRVVDVYRREGEKLAENWVFIDFLDWMRQQSVDVLGRTKSAFR